MPYISLSILIGVSSIFFFTWLSELLIFNRSLIIEGEYWRIFSAHFVHFSWEHYIFNTLIFLIPAMRIEKKSIWNFILLFVLLVFFISVSLFVFEKNLEIYAGLSGISIGMFFYWLLTVMKESQGIKVYMVGAILVAIVFKIGLEYMTEIFFLKFVSEVTFRLVPLSHLSAVIVAIIVFVFLTPKIDFYTLKK